MTQGTIHNREAFLDNIANKLGRERRTKVSKPSWNYRPQWEVFKGDSQDELLATFKKACEPVHTSVKETKAEALPSALAELLTTYGGGSIVVGQDPRFHDFGLQEVLDQNETHIWDTDLGALNIDKAKEANIGISFSDISLAESGTAVFFNDKYKARSISLLPITSIVIVPKSIIVPRITQAMKVIQDRVQAGEMIEPYINMVSGPSNSADIEMNLVVGVHGPIKVAYLIVLDR
ncbi:L-lactate dehydrogenase complex protein LldG [Pullulanibacillus pueri]|uniref:Lactate utilization protein C n=1 Tax=Pullulanibacillus pueri TaxID=1437324 RepID=A0A8J3EM60_9BACL|nr:lactate utilization protein C [Pullulanibacillus pueri]MBM7682377.1 L-lactate dehydrogenase complex protein LldG [Pullulanibacillus pueri]GGH81877.1 lactate utilization protein C [Pullulanibacillus pueri]